MQTHAVQQTTSSFDDLSARSRCECKRSGLVLNESLIKQLGGKLEVCSKVFQVCSRMTSSAFLSVRSPRKAGCRISPSLVHSVNFTSPTSLGISHLVAFSSFTFWSKGFLSVRSGCIVA